jgi:hypothetical protein
MRGSKVAVIAVTVLCLAPSCAAAATTPFELSPAGQFHPMVPGEVFSSFLSVGGKLFGGPMTVETHPGTITCSGVGSYAGLTGTLETNNLPTDSVEMNTPFGILDGTENCSNTSALGSKAVVHLQPRKAILSLSGVEGKAELEAASPEEPILLEVAYSGGVNCFYAAQKFAGALKLEPTGGNSAIEEDGYRQLNIEFENQRMEPATVLSPECPAEVSVTTPFGFQGTWTGENTGGRFIWGRIARPTIAKLAPVKGGAGGGTTVTITGTNYTEVAAVHFGAVAATSFTVNSTTSITATSPEEPVGNVNVTVTNPGGTSGGSHRYKFAPVINSVSPNSGPATGGTSVSITGVGFAPGATTIKFGSTLAASVECTSSTFCTAVTPPHAAGKPNVTATVNKIASLTGPQDRFTFF